MSLTFGSAFVNISFGILSGPVAMSCTPPKQKTDIREAGYRCA